MTKKGIESAVKKITQCKEQGHYLEALIRTYHLNSQLVRFLLESSVPHLSLQNKKVKEVMSLFSLEIEMNSKLKTLMTKKNLKPVKQWLKQMDEFFKSLKSTYPKTFQTHQNQGDAVFKLLNLSANKLFSR
jgi:hypothetical protein